jgi:hypothetical protein
MRIRKLMAGAALATVVVAGMALGSFAPAAHASMYTFDYVGADGLSANGTLDVVAGQAISGTGTITSPLLTGTQSLTLVTLSTPGASGIAGPPGALTYRFGGTDLFGDTAYPLDDYGPIFSVGFGNIGFNFWFNGGTQYQNWLVGGGIYQLQLGTATFAECTDCAPAPSETPLPAALPLFASGLGALGLFGWRRKRKASAAIAAI